MNNKKIFIVDDEIQILTLFKKAFERKGYAIRTAETAEEAILHIMNNPELEGEVLEVLEHYSRDFKILDE